MARRSSRSRSGGAAPDARLRAALDQAVAAVRALALEADVPLPDRLTIDLRPRAPSAERAAAVIADVERAFSAARPADDLWRAGAVHCFWCASSDCAHARPSSPGSVFAGYAATGKAEWVDFVQSCVDRRLPGLDGLFADPPHPVAFVQQQELTGELLPGFGREDHAWRLRGQVVIGMVPADLRAPKGDRVAFAIQVVETRRPQAPLTLRVNLVGMSSNQITAAASAGPARSTAEQLRRLVQGAHRLVKRIGRRAVLAEARNQPYDAEQAIASTLGQLRGDLVRIFAPQSWRTQHAAQRHGDGARPTSKALSDAREAGPDRMFRDTRRETIVVIGPKNRAHVFTESGRHVTSLRLEPGELGRKTQRKRWQPLSPPRISAFRALLKGA